MKRKIFILSMAFLFSLCIKAQITLTQSNTDFTIGVFTPVGASLTGFMIPSAGGNQLWNYSNLIANSTTTLYHVSPANTNFPAATYADTNNSAIFVPGWYYYYDSYTQTSASGVNTLGFSIKNQRYGITITGNPNDSCIFLNQYFVNTNHSYVMPFPTTMNTSWNTTQRSMVKFDLTIAAYGLNNAACQKVTNTVRKDTVVGWGKMRVPTISGASYAYDVLMVKRMTVQTDSFYLNGLAAPANFLTAFGVTQGQTTSDNRYMFWRANARYTLMMINFGSNNFTTASSVYFDGSAQFDPSSINEINQNTDIKVFPNPNHGDFSFQDNSILKEPYEFSIYNVLGQIVNKHKFNPSAFDARKIHVSGLNPGTYFISIVSEKRRLFSKFLIQ